MMRRLLAALAIAAFPTLATAQQNGLPPISLPPNSVIANTLPVPAFAQAVPFSQFFASIFPTAQTCPSNQWVNSLTATGVACAQPGFSNLSGSISGGQIANGTVTNAMLVNPSLTVGTTPISLGSSSTTLAGLLGITFAGSGSGSTTLQAPASASGTLTLPAATDTLVAKATTDTLTNKTISGSSNTLSNIGNSSLTNSAITVHGASCSLGATCTATIVSNSLSGDVALNNTGTYFDGPSVAQGTSGTWFASGTVSLTDTAGAGTFLCKLWDATTIIASAKIGGFGAANASYTASLSGTLASPAANIRISCDDTASTSGKILFNATGNSKDSTLTAYRLN